MTQAEIKYLRSLSEKKFREKEKKFLLEGWRPLMDALNSPFEIEYIAIEQDVLHKKEYQPLVALAKQRSVPLKEIKALQLKQITETVHAQGVVALVHQAEREFNAQAIQSGEFVVACDRISDPGNLGTIIRTCDWFGVKTILLNEGCVSLYNEKVIRSTAGSIFHLSVYEHIDFEKMFPILKNDGFSLFATVMDGESLFTARIPRKTVLLLGSEAHGIDERLLDIVHKRITISKFGLAESLNVGIACGIVLSYWCQQTSSK